MRKQLYLFAALQLTFCWVLPAQNSVITSLSPNSATVGGSPFQLTVNGTGFLPSSTLAWNATVLGTNYVNATQLTTTIPGNLLLTPGIFNVTVTTNGVTSAASTFAVGPYITSVSPTAITAGSAATTISINGAGFVNGANIIWNSATTLPTTFVSSTLLTAPAAANLLTNPGTAVINVQNFPNGAFSNAAGITISASSSPAISSISPASAAVGSSLLILTVNGSNFAPNSAVTWNGALLPTNFVNATQLTAQVAASYLTAAGTAQVAVSTPGQALSNATTFTVSQTATPTVTSIAPASATAGGQAFTLTVNGTNFQNTSAITWNQQSLSTAFVNSTQLTAQVAASLIAAVGTAQIAVNTPGQTLSNAATFNISQANTPPTLTSIAPSSTTAGGQAFTLTVNGTNFLNTSVITWNQQPLTTTVLSSTQLTAQISAAMIASAGTAQVTVSNPNAAQPASLPFTISASTVPSITTLTPSTASPGGAGFTLIVNGVNFTANSAILWNGAIQATNFVSSTQLTANIPAGFIATAATVPVTVTTPGYGASNALTFTIAVNAGPSITSLSPSSTTPGSSSFILTVNGAGFTANSVVMWGSTPLATGFSSTTQLMANVSGTLLSTAGTVSVTVVNGTNVSNAVSFTVGVSNTPTISSLSPVSATVSTSPLTLIVTGTNFVSGAIVYWNSGQVTTLFNSATQLTATIPATLLATPGSASITVVNPSGTNATSNALTFTVTAASAPTLQSLSPTSVGAGSGQFTLTVNGQGFLPSAAVLWNNSPLTTTVVGTTQVTAVVPAGLIASPGAAVIRVANPGSATSLPLNFTITGGSTSTTLFQTTLPPTPAGGSSAASLLSGQFFGNYFVLTSPAQIDSISTFAQSPDSGTIFGAIIAVSNLTTVPTGNPFDGSVVVSQTLRLTPAFAIATATFSPVTLPAGTYAIVFGNGYFQASAQQAYLGVSNGGAASVPAGWNQLNWGSYCNTALPCWSANYSSPSPFYFALTGATASSTSPTITGINPSSSAVGNSIQLTVNGTGFVQGSIVQWSGLNLTTNFVNATQLTATVPVNLVTAGQYSITVLNPNNVISTNSVQFTVTSQPFRVDSLSPASTNAGGPQFPLTVNGAGFLTGTTVLWNGLALPTTFVSSSQLTATVSADKIATATTASISVQLPSGVSVNYPTAFVVTSLPVISSLSPNTILPGSGDFNMTVTGSGFTSASTVQWNGNPLRTLYLSSTQLTATVTAPLVLNATTANITVANSLTIVSAPVAFTVTNPSSPISGLAHFAVGQNWTTGFYIVNSGALPANYSIAFYDDNGNPAVMPFTNGSTTRLVGSLPPYGSTYVEAANPNIPVFGGWGQITADATITVQSLFRNAVGDLRYEAGVGSSSGSREFVIPFDFTTYAPGTPTYTGVAVANMDTSLTATFTCTARDQTGAAIPNGFFLSPIRPLGHYANYVYPALNGQRGTIDCVSTTNVAVIALRFLGTDAFSSLPVIKK